MNDGLLFTKPIRTHPKSAVSTEYFIGDALGSVRQLVDEAGEVRLNRSYEPYGEILTADGEAETDYAFTGENYDPQTGLVYLRARYYAVNNGRFLSSDIWQGNYYLPMSYNNWLYTQANPINYFDPTGLYSGELIHRMIQMHYETTYGMGKIVIPEFPVRGGSKANLGLSDDNGVPILIGTPTGNIGYIDIVNETTKEAFEIKNEKQLVQGAAEIQWYVDVYNALPDPKTPKSLRKGTNYKWVVNGWDIVGVNPYYSGSIIMSSMSSSGVIIYKSVRKDKIPVSIPVPKYMYEYNKQTKSMEKKESKEISGLPQPAYTQKCIQILIAVGITVTLLDPIPGDEWVIPALAGAIP